MSAAFLETLPRLAPAEIIRQLPVLLGQHLEAAVKRGSDRELWLKVWRQAIESLRKAIRRPAAGEDAASSLVSLHALLDQASRFYEDLLAALPQLDAAAADGVGGSFASAVALVEAEAAGGKRGLRHATAAVRSRCLIYLGDIARYRQLHSAPTAEGQEAEAALEGQAWVEAAKTDGWRVAEAFYRRAQLALPQSGNTHNQLAVVATYRTDTLCAIMHYLCALHSVTPFDVARDNLLASFTRAAAAGASGRKRERDAPAAAETSAAAATSSAAGSSLPTVALPAAAAAATSAAAAAATSAADGASLAADPRSGLDFGMRLTRLLGALYTGRSCVASYDTEREVALSILRRLATEGPLAIQPRTFAPMLLSTTCVAHRLVEAAQTAEASGAGGGGGSGSAGGGSSGGGGGGERSEAVADACRGVELLIDLVCALTPAVTGRPLEGSAALGGPAAAAARPSLFHLPAGELPPNRPPPWKIAPGGPPLRTIPLGQPTLFSLPPEFVVPPDQPLEECEASVRVLQLEGIVPPLLWLSSYPAILGRHCRSASAIRSFAAALDGLDEHLPVPPHPQPPPSAPPIAAAAHVRMLGLNPLRAALKDVLRGATPHCVADDDVGGGTLALSATVRECARRLRPSLPAAIAIAEPQQQPAGAPLQPAEAAPQPADAMDVDEMAVDPQQPIEPDEHAPLLIDPDDDAPLLVEPSERDMAGWAGEGEAVGSRPWPTAAPGPG